MSTDITMAAFQDDVASSILDAPIVAQFSHEGNFGNVPYPEGSEGQESVFDDAIDLLNEGIEDTKAAGDLAYAFAQAQVSPEDAERERQESLVLSPEERALRRMERDEREQPEPVEAEQQPEQRQPEQVQPLTPEQSEKVVANVHATVEQLGLNQDAQQFAADFAAVTGNKDVNPGLLADTMSIATLGVYSGLVAAQGDLTKLVPPHDGWAAGCADAYALAIGRNTPMNNPVGVGREIFYGLANLIHTRAITGSSDPIELNKPENCVGLVERVHKEMTGFDVQISEQDRPLFEEAAVHFVNNVLTPYALARLDKIRSEQGRLRDEQTRQGQRSRSNIGRGRGQRIPRGLAPGIRGSKAPRSQSNRDIFSGPGFEAALRQHL